MKLSVLVTSSSTGVIFNVRVIPRARKTAVAGTREGALVVRLAAPPVDGAANVALIDCLAGLLDRPRRDVAIVAGHTAREKRVAVWGMTTTELTARLSDILPA